MVVADGKGNSCVEGISIIDLGRTAGSRLRRALLASARAFRQTRRLRPAVIHFHDPELIPAAIVMKLTGRTVVYDAHEDLPRQILGKHWIPRGLRRTMALVAAVAEWSGVRVFDAIVAATPTIAKRFPARKTVLVQNYPLLDELTLVDQIPYSKRPARFVYVGGLTRMRGVVEMVEAVGEVDRGWSAELDLAGNFSPASLGQHLAGSAGFHQTRLHGWLDRAGVSTLLGNARAGLVLLHPSPSYVDSQPIKLFEYMSTGLPVIASDFPLWRGIIDGVGCGLLVNPLDPNAIARAMTWILKHPDEAEAMGRRGRQAVEQRYNWKSEAAKLVDLYRHLVVATVGTPANGSL